MNCAACLSTANLAWKYCPHCGEAISQRPLYGDGILSEVQRRPGLKLDDYKAKVWTGAFMSFPRALEAVARKTIEGTAEPGHTLHGWKTVPDGFKRYSEALARHCLQEGLVGPTEEYDCVVTVAWNSLARLEHYLKPRDEGSEQQAEG